jgi:hypothetical protein
MASYRFGPLEMGPDLRESQTLYMLYAKNEPGDLTPAQVKILAQLVREEFT